MRIWSAIMIPPGAGSTTARRMAGKIAVPGAELAHPGACGMGLGFIHISWIFDHHHGRGATENHQRAYEDQNLSGEDGRNQRLREVEPPADYLTVLMMMAGIIFRPCHPLLFWHSSEVIGAVAGRSHSGNECYRQSPNPGNR
jgi:hypothetical protein